MGHVFFPFFSWVSFVLSYQPEVLHRFVGEGPEPVVEINEIVVVVLGIVVIEVTQAIALLLVYASLTCLMSNSFCGGSNFLAQETLIASTSYCREFMSILVRLDYRRDSLSPPSCTQIVSSRGGLDKGAHRKPYIRGLWIRLFGWAI